MIDSGATEHIMPYATDLTTYLPLGSTQSVTLANQQTRCPILGKGLVTATTIVDGKKVEIRLQNVLHVPGIGKRFISTQHLDQKDSQSRTATQKQS